MSSSSNKSRNMMMKHLKENERLLMDVESKLSEQLENLKREEIYLKTIIIREKEEGDEHSGDEDEDVNLDDDNMNKAPLEHLDTATTNFYKMFAGKERTIPVHDVEEEEEDDEEEDSEGAKKTEEEQSAEFKRLMSSMQGEG